ncbi:testin LIM domain protein [Leptinotarsa decemlineata]|uniref:testin LIM domain protein n=1 Tax=Leptinotarsa decemlineata TaxID=7539 RepID=UPI003D304087
MSGEIVVPETPNWLQELEAKRERRLKAKLGHEAGAGAPCLKCAEKCPGLDLHFWRKCCKLCKCPKEEHEVQDDDIYGWAQFQLVGSKPNKIRKKILLPGKKDELDLDWAPKGHNDTVDKYLKTLSTEQLPVKGSQAAQDRKQLLQKQIPIHDIDPSLCHDLTEEELKKMNEYIAHVKESSAGVGQIVSLSSIIKGNLHMLNPAESAMMASRYAKGIPLSEIVKLQSQSKALSLKPQELIKNLENITLNDKSLPYFAPDDILNQPEKLNMNDKNLPKFVPNTLNQTEYNLDPLVPNKFNDKNYPSYSNDTISRLSSAQFSGGLVPQRNKGSGDNQSVIDPSIDPKYLQKNNFDFKSRPSQFLPQNVPYNLPQPGQNVLSEDNSGIFDSGSSAFVPYQKTSTTMKPGESYVQSISSMDPSYSSNFPVLRGNVSSGLETGDESRENLDAVDPNYAITSSPALKYKESGSSTVGRSPQSANHIRKENNLFSGEVNPLTSNYPKSVLPEFKFGKTGSLPDQASQKSNSNQKENAGYHQSLENVDPLEQNYSKIASPEYRYQKSVDSAVGKWSQDPRSFGQGKGILDNDVPYDESLGRKYRINDQIGNKNTSNIIPNKEVLQKFAQGNTESVGAKENYENTHNMKNMAPRLPNYAPGRYSNHSDVQSPSNIPKNFRDLAFSTHDPSNASSNDLGDTESEFKFGHYRKPGSYPENENSFSRGETPKNSSGFRPIQANWRNAERPINQHLPEQQMRYQNEPVDNLVQNQNPNSENNFDNKNSYSNMALPSDEDLRNVSSSGGLRKPLDDYNSDTFDKQALNNLKQLGKNLPEMHPGSLIVDETFLHPSQVNVGLIQDISYPEIKAATQGTNDFYEDYSPDIIREILNNMKLPDCHYCKRPFEEKEFAITIERANVLFHTGCFKCAGCNQIIADNVYFYNKESDNIYCLRDYAKIRGFPRCKACDELIFTKEYCLAENSTFHLKHFCCIECDTPLAGKDYTLEDEMPYCLPCFEQSKASKCSSCNRVIKPDEIGCNLNGVHFHANDECFACKVCKKPLMKKKMLLRNEKLYCSHECYGTEK